MSFKAEKISSNQYKISFEVPSADFDAAMQQSYQKNRGRFNVPGFRKGKAPRRLIENMYGESVFYEDAFDLIFPDLYEEAVKAEDLFPVDQPSVSVDQIASGQDLKFTATVYVKPDVTLGEYKGLKGTRHLHPVPEEEIEHRISHDTQKMTTTEDVGNRELLEGDTANIDYLGRVDGLAFEGGQADGHNLVLGSDSFIPGFEEQVIGMKVGDEKVITVTFPEQYHSEALAGKEAQFEVKVNSATHEVKPELDDDFAQDVSEYKTFKEYRDAIVRELEERRDKQAENNLENELVQKAVDAADCDIPDAMVERQIDRQMLNMKLQMAYQGLRMEDYLRYTNTTEEDLRDNIREDAKNNVKAELVIDEIARVEKLEPSLEEIEEQIKRYAKEAGQELEAYKAGLSENQKENFKDIAVSRKVIDLLVKNAEISVHEGEHDEPVDVQEVLESVTEALDEEENKTPAKKTGKKAKDKLSED